MYCCKCGCELTETEIEHGRDVCEFCEGGRA
jgi:hypothetical protein